jgi:sortase B
VSKSDGDETATTKLDNKEMTEVKDAKQEGQAVKQQDNSEKAEKPVAQAEDVSKSESSESENVQKKAETPEKAGKATTAKNTEKSEKTASHMRQKHGEHEAEKSGMSKKKKIILFASVTAAVTALTSVVVFGILPNINKPSDEPSEPVVATGEPDSLAEPKPDFVVPTGQNDYVKLGVTPTTMAKNLEKINPDAIGYIRIKGPKLKVDYPIMRGKDNWYYAHYTIYHAEEAEGSILLDHRNKFGADDDDISTNLVIYGHNMASTAFAQMFGELKQYRFDWNYWKKAPVIEVSTQYETHYYLVSALFPQTVKVNVFDYWNPHEFATEKDFNDFVGIMKQKSFVNIDVDMSYGDKILVLSTCQDSNGEVRFVVVGRRLREGEELPNYDN